MILVTTLKNILYLTGFTGSSGFLFLGKSKNYFVTDFRYKTIAEKLEKDKTRIDFEFVLMSTDLEKILKKLTKNSKIIEFENKHLTVSDLKRWKKKIKGKKWITIKKPIENLRLQKDKTEIKLLKKSQKINGEAFYRIKKLCKKGVTELEIAWQIKVLSHELGAEDISFEPIVAFGSNSASPHHQNSNRKLKVKDLVLIDMGMKYQGYCSDMTRTFFKGKPTTEQATIYNKVLDSQIAAIKACKTGVKCSTLDKIARKSMKEDAQHFGHSLGHGIGLDVHENPGISSNSKETLKENMIVTIEPGIYLPGKFGVRIEDMGLITKTGFENFTKVEKHL